MTHLRPVGGSSVTVFVVEDDAAWPHPDHVGDRMEMAHSIEGRVPFLDHHVGSAGEPSPSIPFFDQRNVVGLLDPLGSMDESARVANDQILMLLTSACVLQARFQLAA